MKRLIAVSAAVVILIGLAQAQGAITTYNTRASWEAAVGGSGWFWEEDFNSFLTDTEFRTGPVDLGEFTLQQDGPDVFGTSYNRIDVAPFFYVNIDASPYALVLVNHDATDTTVDMVFDAPIWAWGAEFNLGLQGELLAVVKHAGGAEETIAVPNPSDPFFFGFTTNPMEWIESITFVPQKTISGTVEAFAMDNVVGAPIPEPATFVIWSLLGTLAIGLGWLRRRVG
ncbi:MAG: hypothetical protein JW809_10400 [Pirellulales bacterium]|nr:hypothetical protein [Pirellulales bacterium]